jgi:DNA-directed RNA polymerase specialized sigma subunit
MPRSRIRVGLGIAVDCGTPSTSVGHSETRAENDYEALARCAPGEEPERSLSNLAGLREILCEALETLSERELWIFESLVYRRLSLKQCAVELNLSKTHIFRLREQINKKLQDILEPQGVLNDPQEGRSE